MRLTSFLAIVTLASAVSAAPAAAQAPPVRNLQLAFHADGTVSLSAQSVSVREILSEWARQCGCYLVNWDKLTGGPLTVPIQFEKATQAKVLESLLRQATGYVLTPRREGSTAVSNYETIYILPTSTAVAGAYVPPVSPPPPMPMPMPTPGGPDDEIPAVVFQPTARPTLPGQGPTQSPVAPGMVPGAQFPRPGGSVFVPIVPVTSPQATAPAGQTPGMSPPPLPVPIVPAPPQGR